MALLNWHGDVDEYMPVYVTRKTASGTTGHLSMSVKQAVRNLLIVQVLFWLWAIVAFVYGVKLLVDLALSVF